ncbi:response regulator [bacterium]|nr:response regulator [Candidatus Omnitrophota bacterium]MBU2529352.1 response regulator [bacterium]MBU3930310.1 response regulator [bacterium]MBU4123618.1 response regulator [bacterium]
MRHVKELSERNIAVVSGSHSIGDAVRMVDGKEIDYLVVKFRGEIKGIIPLRHIIGYPSSRLLADCPVTAVEKIPDSVSAQEALKLMDNKKAEISLLMGKNNEPLSVIKREKIIAYLSTGNELKKLYDEKKEYEFIVNNSKELMTIIDRNYTYTAANDAYCRAHGRKREEIVGKTIAEIWGRETFERKIKNYIDRALNGEEVHYSEAFEFSASPTRYFDVSYYPYKRRNSEISYLVTVTRDITEQDKMQKKMLQQSRLAGVGRLAAGVAHELNNPLTTIVSLNDLISLTAEDRLNDDDKKNLAIIKKESLRMKKIILSLLSLSREKKMPNKNFYNIEEIIDEAIGLANIKAEGIFMKREKGQLSNINIDREEVLGALLNIIINGIYAMKDIKKRTFKITTIFDKKRNEIAIDIEDNGEGIDETVIKKIFDPFFTTKPVNVGTGLGLSEVYGVMQKHGGSVEVKSAKGKGTSIVLRFPCKEKLRGLNQSPCIYRMLVIDDDIQLLSFVRKALEMTGRYEVFTAGDGFSGAKILHSNNFDVIVLDIRLPGHDGYNLCAEIKSYDAAIKILAITGDGREGVREKILAAGADGFLQKPFKGEELEKEINSVLNNISVNGGLK